jgi:hypothetical protein
MIKPQNSCGGCNGCGSKENLTISEAKLNWFWILQKKQ